MIGCFFFFFTFVDSNTSENCIKKEIKDLKTKKELYKLRETKFYSHCKPISYKYYQYCNNVYTIELVTLCVSEVSVERGTYYYIFHRINDRMKYIRSQGFGYAGEHNKIIITKKYVIDFSRKKEISFQKYKSNNYFIEKDLKLSDISKKYKINLNELSYKVKPESALIEIYHKKKKILLFKFKNNKFNLIWSFWK